MVDLRRDFCAYLLVVCLSTAAGIVLGDSVSEGNGNAVVSDPIALRVISDEDKSSMEHIASEISRNYENFNTINDVHTFLDKVKLLVQKHPKNIAFAQGNLKELYKLLSSEEVTRLIRVDTDPFVIPIADERTPVALRAVEDDELTRKLFGRALRSLIENRKQSVSRTDDGNHKDGNFFTSFWCKISGSCNN